MQNFFQKWAIALSFCGLLFAFPLLLANTQPASPADTCPAPTVSVSATGDNFATFQLSSPYGNCQYWYVNKNTNTQSGVVSTSGTSVTISGLAPGAYDFYFKSVCEAGQTSDYMVSELIIGQ